MGEEETPFDKEWWVVTLELVIYTSGLFALIGGLTWLSWSWINPPIGFWDLWGTKDSITEGVVSVWPIFAWGVGLTLIVGIIQAIKGIPREYEPGYLFAKGTWVSMNAGLFEEIIYRWIMLFGAMLGLKIFNLITFGLVKWLYETILIPLANWTSFGLLDDQLNGQYGWLFAAAIISANIRFRNGHEYQGLFGMLNAWYIGLILFYLVFSYGLWAAIVAHILYDFCVFWSRSLTATLQP